MTVDIDQVALDIARQFVDGGQRKAQLQVAIIEAINRFAKPGSAWKADRAGAAWVVASPSGDACEVRDTDRSPYAEVMRQLAQSLGNSEIGGEVDVYYQIADMIEPHVQREGINPNGALPASVHDSVQILFNHWLATRNAPVIGLTNIREELAGIHNDWIGPGPATDKSGCCLSCGSWTPWGNPEKHDHEDGCVAEAEWDRRRSWQKRIRDLIAKIDSQRAATTGVDRG